MAKSGYSQKSKNLHEMLKAFQEMPVAMANQAKLNLYDDVLNGNPINHDTNDLRNSWDVVTAGYAGILKQTKNFVPYAEWVMVPYAIRKVNKPALEHLMDIMRPKFEYAIKEEFKHLESAIAAGGKYKWNKASFETMIFNR